MSKKILTITIILLIIIAIILLIYNFSSPKKTTNTNIPENIPRDSDQRGVSSETELIQSKIQSITQEKAFWPIFDENKNKVIYFNSEGNLFESGVNGEDINKISDLTLNNLIKIIWSPMEKERILAIFNENGLVKKYLYDYQTGSSISLNSNIQWVNWSPDGKKIVYQYHNPKSEESDISISNPDGSGWKNIFKTRLDNLIIDWPIKDKISIMTPVSGLSQGLLYTINPNNSDFQRILSDLFGLNIKWSPKADKILFTNTNADGKNLTLSVADSNGQNIKSLDSATIVEKCAWSLDNKNIFCAVPRNLSVNAIWPDDYYKNKLVISDDFYQINTETSNKNRIIELGRESAIDAQNLFLSPKEDYLFFTDRANGKLHRIKIY